MRGLSKLMVNTEKITKIDKQYQKMSNMKFSFGSERKAVEAKWSQIFERLKGYKNCKWNGRH